MLWCYAGAVWISVFLSREYKVGVYKGMAELPASWGLASGTQLSDTKDIASYEVLGSQGINIDNPTTSFWLDLALN